MSIITDAVPLADAQLPDLDVQSEAFLADPFGVLSEVALEAPLARSQRGLEVLRYDLVNGLLNDKRADVVLWDYFAQKGAPEIMLEYLEKGLLSNMDRERHDRVRRVFVQGFRPGRIDAHRATLAPVADRLIDGFIDTGRCDVIEDFSGHFSIEVLCALIGVPLEDIPTFAHATQELALIFASPLDPVRDRLQTALQQLWAYSSELVARRRELPPDKRPDDFVSSLVALQETGERIEGDELVWGIASLLFAGMDTTRFQIAASLQELIRQGAWEDVAADPSLLPGVLEEITRLAPVIGFVPRRTLETFDIEGVLVPEGTLLMLNILAATRDPAKFPDPYRFDHTRPLGTRLIFGRGLHRCIGDRLAWMILEVALERFTARLADPTVSDTRFLTPRNEQLLGHACLELAFAKRSA
jgi:cytochrome P450